jgi:hypothetical protein
LEEVRWEIRGGVPVVTEALLFEVAWWVVKLLVSGRRVIAVEGY